MSMNREQSDRFRDRHLGQKYNLLHMLPSIQVPELSGLYLKSFHNGAKRYKVQLPAFIEDSDSKFCGSCGCIRIPNYNVKMYTIEYTDVETGGISRNLEYRCVHCNHVAKFSMNNAFETVNSGSVPPAKTTFTATWPKTVRQEAVNSKVEKRNSAKDRAKKRKMNSLSSLLSKKNNEKKNKNSPSMSLESFMHSG